MIRWSVTLLQAAALTCSRGLCDAVWSWWHQHGCPGSCSCGSTCLCAMTLGFSTETCNGTREHTPSREKYIFKTPAMSETRYLRAVPQRPEKMVKVLLKEFLTVLDHLSSHKRLSSCSGSSGKDALDLTCVSMQGFLGCGQVWLGRSDSWPSVGTQVYAPPNSEPTQTQHHHFKAAGCSFSHLWAKDAEQLQPFLTTSPNEISLRACFEKKYLLCSPWEKKWKVNDNFVKKITSDL